MPRCTSLIFSFVFVLLCHAQFPTTPSGLISLESKLDPAVKITYKQTHICETTPGVKSYSGYVHLPASTLEGIAEYNISTFFWYFEARHNPKSAPLAIYLAGGPGQPSTEAAVSSESGPCYVNPDGNSTTLNPWSFNQHVNTLYLDQPVQTGFSYNILINGTYDLVTGKVTPSDFTSGVPEQNSTYLAGTFSGQDPLQTTNTSIASTKVLWRFAEHWITTFPHYDTRSRQIGIWGNSYGGYWVPAATAYFDQQIKASSHSHPKLHSRQIATMGITNGCVDFLTQAPYYPQYMYNNTYEQLIPEEVYQDLSHNFTKPGGCKDLIEQCRELGDLSDSDWIGANETINEACTLATAYCYEYVIGSLSAIGRDDFDIAISAETIDSCPGGAYTPNYKFLNQPWVLADLGVSLNWTFGSNVILSDYSLNINALEAGAIGTGDSFRRGKGDFEYALQNDIGVSMIFGDRDYRCNWLAGEALSLEAKYPGKKDFNKAGYEKIVTNKTYDGGVVRQYGKFSFARVFESGHSVSAYQPETVYRIFQRSMFGQDVATGTEKVGSQYSSKGPASSFGIKHNLPKSPNGCIVEGKFVKNQPL